MRPEVDHRELITKPKRAIGKLLQINIFPNLLICSRILPAIDSTQLNKFCPRRKTVLADFIRIPFLVRKGDYMSVNDLTKLI